MSNKISCFFGNQHNDKNDNQKFYLLTHRRHRRAIALHDQGKEETLGGADRLRELQGVGHVGVGKAKEVLERGVYTADHQDTNRRGVQDNKEMS